MTGGRRGLTGLGLETEGGFRETREKLLWRWRARRKVDGVENGE